MIPPMARPDATFLKFARALKPRLSIPVIAVGRLGDPAIAQAALADHAWDFIALGRPLLADPDWSRTVRAGGPDLRLPRRRGQRRRRLRARLGSRAARCDPPGRRHDLRSGSGETLARALCRWPRGGTRFRYGVDVAKEPEVLLRLRSPGGGHRRRLSAWPRCDHHHAVVDGNGTLAGPALAVGAVAATRFSLLLGPAPDGRDHRPFRRGSPAIIGDAAAAGKTAAAIASAFDAAWGHPANLSALARTEGSPRGEGH